LGKTLTVIGLVLFGIGCSNINFSEKDLTGTWQAVLLTEGQDTFMYDLNNVRLNFEEDKRYSYQGNLKNQEAGTYHLIGKILYTKDTINSNAEKAVEIMNLQNDSLKLKMNDSGNIRILSLIKSKSKTY